MSAPGLTFSVTGNKISAVSGFDSITVSFSSDVAYQAFECRATKAGGRLGSRERGADCVLLPDPAGTQRTFEVYDDFLLSGDGEYRISLFAQAMDGSWNDNWGFIPSGETDTMLTADGEEFLCMKE